MNALLQSKSSELAQVCKRHGVRRLAVFGSAARSDFASERSDLDFIVEFMPMPPLEHGEAYLRLAEELEQLFARPVDLVEMQTVRNPFLRRSIEASEVTVYAA